MLFTFCGNNNINEEEVQNENSIPKNFRGCKLAHRSTIRRPEIGAMKSKRWELGLLTLTLRVLLHLIEPWCSCSGVVCLMFERKPEKALNSFC